MRKNEAFKENWFNLVYPLIFAIICLVVKQLIHVHHRIEGFNDVLTSLTTFTSIIIGFYTAMYGVLLTIYNSDFMKSVRKEHLQGLLKFQLYDSLIASFLAFLVSVIVQVFQHYESIFSSIIFNIWVFIVSYFIATSFRSVSLLLNIMFHHDDRKNKQEKRSTLSQEQIDEINKINSNL